MQESYNKRAGHTSGGAPGERKKLTTAGLLGVPLNEMPRRASRPPGGKSAVRMRTMTVLPCPGKRAADFRALRSRLALSRSGLRPCFSDSFFTSRAACHRGRQLGG